MTLRQYILFFIPAIIWGSTWFAIKFQLGTVDPMASVAYRFMLAGVLLLAYCILTGKKLAFTLKEHLMMLLLGASLFGFNYWFVYQAETIFTSGVVAVIFSLIIFFNIFFNALFLHGKIKKEVIFAAILGVGGTALLFKHELTNLALTNESSIGLLFCLAGIILASLGNILSAYKQKKKIPVLQANAFAMTYGSIMMFVAIGVAGKPLNFDYSISYSLSLIYLAILGSIIAFTSYLKLLGEIGPDRSAYIALITPVLAMVISTLFENYHWQPSAIAGIILLLAGNILALKFKHKKIAL